MGHFTNLNLVLERKNQLHRRRTPRETMFVKVLEKPALFFSFVLLIPVFILYYLHIWSFSSISQLLSLIPGYFGIAVRQVWYQCTLAKCGKNLTIGFLSAIHTPKIRAGNNVYIAGHSNIFCAEIGDDTLISGQVDIIAGGANHGIKDLTTPIRLQEGEMKHVKIGKDCWIGCQSIIMTSVADHTVIGAGSVVTKTFKPFDIIAGVPAKKLRSRKD